MQCNELAKSFKLFRIEERVNLNSAGGTTCKFIIKVLEKIRQHVRGVYWCILDHQDANNCNLSKRTCNDKQGTCPDLLIIKPNSHCALIEIKAEVKRKPSGDPKNYKNDLKKASEQLTQYTCVECECSTRIAVFRSELRGTLEALKNNRELYRELDIDQRVKYITIDELASNI